jgi:hypothetical protein
MDLAAVEGLVVECAVNLIVHRKDSEKFRDCDGTIHDLPLFGTMDQRERESK